MCKCVRGTYWGNRDDSFRGGADESVAWLEGSAGSTTLRLYRYVDAAVFADGFESGGTDRWSSTTL